MFSNNERSLDQKNKTKNKETKYLNLCCSWKFVEFSKKKTKSSKQSQVEEKKKTKQKTESISKEKKKNKKETKNTVEIIQ